MGDREGVRIEAHQVHFAQEGGVAGSVPRRNCCNSPAGSHDESGRQRVAVPQLDLATPEQSSLPRRRSSYKRASPKSPWFRSNVELGAPAAPSSPPIRILPRNPIMFPAFEDAFLFFLPTAFSHRFGYYVLLPAVVMPPPSLRPDRGAFVKVLVGFGPPAACPSSLHCL